MPWWSQAAWGGKERRYGRRLYRGPKCECVGFDLDDARNAQAIENDIEEIGRNGANQASNISLPDD